jgi:hypothetical protein
VLSRLCDCSASGKTEKGGEGGLDILLEWLSCTRWPEGVGGGDWRRKIQHDPVAGTLDRAKRHRRVHSHFLPHLPPSSVRGPQNYRVSHVWLKDALHTLADSQALGPLVLTERHTIVFPGFEVFGLGLNHTPNFDFPANHGTWDFTNSITEWPIPLISPVSSPSLSLSYYVLSVLSLWRSLTEIRS